MALVDSGASFNFISRSLVSRLGWKLHENVPSSVRLANGDKLTSLGAVFGLVQCGKWQAHIYFVVLDLTFDLVLGLPWLTAVNPRLDWR